MFTLALMIALSYILFLQADADGGALYLAGSATASLDSGSVTMANNAASDGVDIFVTSATLTCQTTCVANEVPSTPCTDAILPAGAQACPLACGACSMCPADKASTVVGSVDANDCVDANCDEYEEVGVDGTCTAMVAQCDTLACGTGYVLKSNAASLSCANYPCDVATADKDTCCEETTCTAKDAGAWATLGCSPQDSTGTSVGALGTVSPADGYSFCIVACLVDDGDFDVSVAMPCGTGCLEGSSYAE